MKKEFKVWTKEEVEKFCEDNFIEDVDWLQDFVCDPSIEAHLEMDDSENENGDLIVIIKGKPE